MKNCLLLDEFTIYKPDYWDEKSSDLLLENIMDTIDRFSSNLEYKFNTTLLNSDDFDTVEEPVESGGEYPFKARVVDYIDPDIASALKSSGMSLQDAISIALSKIQ